MAQAALGASGVVTGFSAAATCLMPFARMGFMFIPVAMPMWVMTGVYLGVDLYLLGSNDNVGHDAHIGGALCGMLYYAVFLRKFGGISSMLRLRR